MGVSPSSPTSILTKPPPLITTAADKSSRASASQELRGATQFSKFCPSATRTPSTDTTLGDINFLHQFKQRMVDKQGQKVGGRYSLIDRNMKTVESQQTHVITQLWKIPSMKHAKALLGQMESCDSDVLEIGGEQVDSRTSASAEQFTAKVETDYRVHLVEKIHYRAGERREEKQEKRGKAPRQVWAAMA